jgi:hypothetical protein
MPWILPMLASKSAEADDCGFLRYKPSSSDLIHLAWSARQPGGFGVYYLNIVRGASGIGTLPLPAT